MLTLRDVDEIAESAPGAVPDAVTRKIQEEIKQVEASGTRAPIASSNASGAVLNTSIKDGKAELEKEKAPLA